jgi:hypothetical protein
LDLFRAEVTEIGLIPYGDPADHLIVDSWTERLGRRQVRLS